MKKNAKLPVLATVGAGVTGYQMYKIWAASAGAQNRGKEFILYTTGMNLDTGKGLSVPKLLGTFGPAVLGAAGSILASKLKFNRMISAIPYLKW